MQLTNTMDYAIRIVCYLAIKRRRVTTAKLASELKIPENYIPKITKQLKKRKLFQLLKVPVEDMPLPKIQKRFLYLISYHVWNQQWQSVAVLKRMDFGRFYIILKVNLAENSYECIYSHNRGIYDDVKTAGTYDDFLKVYCEKYVCEKLQEFLKSDSLTEHLKKGCSEEDIVY